MATTTNYGWTTPDDTALVKDGAAAIRTLGSSVDTTTKALNPSTTLGDIEYRSSTANTNTRLGIGSTGNILTVAGGVPTWAAPAPGGGLALLSTTSLSTNTVTISSISGSYKYLHVIVKDLSSSANDNIQIRFNSNTGSNYAWSRIRVTGSTVGGSNATGNTSIDIMESFTSSAWNNAGFMEMIIPRYTETEIKAIYLRSLGSGASSRKVDWTQGTFNSTSAISSITIFCEAGATTFSSGTVYVYGVS
jgi:hypothetical protein